jgi:hypothetical protein
MDGPFGPRRVTYADYTASGRSLDFIQDFIRDAVGGTDDDLVHRRGPDRQHLPTGRPSRT